MKYKVGTKFRNRYGQRLKITKIDEKKGWYYFIEMGMVGIVNEQELKEIIIIMEYEEEE